MTVNIIARRTYPVPYSEYDSQLRKETLFHPFLSFDPVRSEDYTAQTA